jgi:hypothetical protein
MVRACEAGGPTGTMREPNSTPIVTSWWGENRPSQRRMVSWWVVSRGGGVGLGGVRWTCRSPSPRARLSSRCSPTVASWLWFAPAGGGGSDEGRGSRRRIVGRLRGRCGEGRQCRGLGFVAGVPEARCEVGTRWCRGGYLVTALLGGVTWGNGRRSLALGHRAVWLEHRHDVWLWRRRYAEEGKAPGRGLCKSPAP